MGDKWEEWWRSPWHWAVLSTPLFFHLCWSHIIYIKEEKGRKGDSHEGTKGLAGPGNQCPLLMLQDRPLPGKEQILVAAFLDQNGAHGKKWKWHHKPTLGPTETLVFVSLSLRSELRFSNENRLNCVAYHFLTPKASFYGLMSLLLTTTIHLWTKRNSPASLQGVWSLRVDFPEGNEDVRCFLSWPLGRLHSLYILGCPLPLSCGPLVFLAYITFLRGGGWWLIT